MRLRLLSAATATISTAATLAFVGAPSASAADGTGDTFNIRSISVSDVHVRSTSCVNTPMSVTFDSGAARGGETSVSADVEIWRGSRQVDTAFVYGDPTPTSSTFTLRDSYLFCPWVDELGTLTAGPSQVDGSAYDPEWYDTLAEEQFTDYTRTRFHARQDSRTSLTATRLSGGRTRFTVVPSYFSVNSSAWKRWGSKTVTLQRLSSTGSWVRVASVTTSRRGTGTKTISVARGKRFRVVTGGTSATWSSTSATRTS